MPSTRGRCRLALAAVLQTGGAGGSLRLEQPPKEPRAQSWGSRAAATRDGKDRTRARPGWATLTEPNATRSAGSVDCTSSVAAAGRLRVRTHLAKEANEVLDVGHEGLLCSFEPVRQVPDPLPAQVEPVRVAEDVAETQVLLEPMPVGRRMTAGRDSGSGSIMSRRSRTCRSPPAGSSPSSSTAMRLKMVSPVP